MTKLKLSRRDFIKTSLAATAVVAAPAIVRAQSFPSRPIKLICPWTVGGTTDVVVRAFADSASRALGGTIIVENKPGAGGILGAVELANAKPDGYTLAQLPISIFRIPHTQKVSFDPIKDLTYVACLTGYTFGMVVRSDSPIKNIADLVAYCQRPSRTVHLWFARHDYNATPGGGTVCAQGRGKDDACPFQRRRRRPAGIARRPCDGT
jgi:tripartite-type tricarboxylate transporter receptor subunit TctC